MSSPQHKARARGASFEYRIAELLGGIRVGLKTIVKLPSGRFVELKGKRPDVLTEIFSIECKNKQDCTKELSNIMRQCEANTPDGFVGVAAIRDKERGRIYYVIEERDFVELFGKKES